MKIKKKILIINTILLIITTFVISKTFAKYKSAIDLSDEARVAKWDIEINKLSDVNIDLFSDSYLNNNVLSLNGDKVVAPGTSGEYKFQITGAPETSYKIRIDVDEEKTFDCIHRIRYTIDNKYTTYDIEEAAYIIQNFIYNSNTVYEPNSKRGENNSDIHTISWLWEFEIGESSGGVLLDQLESTDKIDTDLGKGDLIYNKDDVRCKDRARVGLSFKITAEQHTSDTGLAQPDNN